MCSCLVRRTHCKHSTPSIHVRSSRSRKQANLQHDFQESKTTLHFEVSYQTSTVWFQYQATSPALFLLRLNSHAWTLQCNYLSQSRHPVSSVFFNEQVMNLLAKSPQSNVSFQSPVQGVPSSFARIVCVPRCISPNVSRLKPKSGHIGCWPGKEEWAVRCGLQEKLCAIDTTTSTLVSNGSKFHQVPILPRDWLAFW